MTEKHFAAIDLGATSGRVLLGSTDGDKLRTEEIRRFANPITEVSGHCYWDLLAIYREITQGLRLIARRRISLASIGIDSWGVDFAAFGRDGELLRAPYCYRDPHTEGAPEAFFERMPREELYRRTGIQIMNFNTLFQFDTLRRNGSPLLAAADRLLFIPDALSYLLTGEAVTEYTIASTSQLLDPRTRRMDDRLLGMLGIRSEQFGRPVTPGERIGTLTPEVQRITGLGPAQVVAVAGHDTASAVAAVPAGNADFAYLSSGTWSLMGIEVPEAIVTEDSYTMNFTNEGGVDGTVRFLKNITGMWLLEQCRAAWSREGRQYDYETILRMTRQAPPSPAVIDPDAAEFAAPTDMPKAIRVWCAEHGIPAPADDAALMRLIFDSLAAKYAEVLGKLRQTAPFGIECLHVIGGGAQNDLLNRMTADAIGIPVVAGPAEATALGNIMVQARAAGVVRSLAEMRQYIRRSIGTKIYQPKK